VRVPPPQTFWREDCTHAFCVSRGQSEVVAGLVRELLRQDEAVQRALRGGQQQQQQRGGSELEGEGRTAEAGEEQRQQDLQQDAAAAAAAAPARRSRL
jgi:hypothetical protein